MCGEFYGEVFGEVVGGVSILSTADKQEPALIKHLPRNIRNRSIEEFGSVEGGSDLWAACVQTYPAY